jgi:Na+-driven multidrug efflux pump
MTIDLFVRFALSFTRYRRGRWKRQLDRIQTARAQG